MKKISIITLLLSLLIIAGCAPVLVERPAYYVPPPGYHYSVWVPGYYAGFRWVPGHYEWR